MKMLYATFTSYTSKLCYNVSVVLNATRPSASFFATCAILIEILNSLAAWVKFFNEFVSNSEHV